MSQSFIKYIKCVGTGTKHNRDLTYEEMYDAMSQMLEGEASKEQIAAFLLGWRLKPETPLEFRAALAAIDKVSKRYEVNDAIELGYPFDGKVDNPYIFPLAARFLEPFGVNITIPGGALQPAKGGATVKEIVESLSMPANLHYFDRSNYSPKLAALTSVRQELGIRTGLNTLERLPGITGCDTALIGVFHKPYVKKYVEIFGERYRRLVIVKGNEGTPEIFGKCRIWVCESQNCEEISIDPAKFGIEYKKSFKPMKRDKSIEMVKSPSKELLQIAKLNAALWLFAKGVADSMESGFEMIAL